MQILKGLYQIGGSLNGQTWTGGYGRYEDANSYALQSKNGVILFDCGNGDTLAQILKNLSYWGYKTADIKACFITHPHLDHAGACHTLEQYNIPIYASKPTAEALKAGDERCCGFLYHKEFMKSKEVRTVEDGSITTIDGISIQSDLYPGHTKGCTAFGFKTEDTKVVVSGDIIGTLLGGHFGWDGSIDFDKKVYIQSLLRFSKQPMDLMLSGHGLIHYHSPKCRVEESLNEALMRWR